MAVIARRPWRRCSACGGVCHWHDTHWVCDDPECGSEWDEDHAPRFAPPGPKPQRSCYRGDCDLDGFLAWARA